MLRFLQLRRNKLLLDVCVYPVLILLVNVLIVAREFRVEYSAYLESNEGSFIAIARNLASHPADLLWWPLWDLGIPFQNTYIPGLHILVATFSRLAGHSPALSFHQVSATFYALGPVAVYFMARTMTHLPGTSFFAALAYSIVSPSAWLMPQVRNDLGGAFHLRRLQILAYYGEGPHTACLFFIPLAVLLLWLAMTKGRVWMKVTAGLVLGLAVVMNAFAAVILAVAAVVLAAINPAGRPFRKALLLFCIAVPAYLWISPLLPPSVAADIRSNSSREYPFDAASAMGLGFVIAASACVWYLTKNRISAALRMFLIYTLILSLIVLLAYYAGCNIVPQPHRYSTAMDMGICLSAVFGAAAILRARWRRLLPPLAVVLVMAAAVQVRHDIRYARRLIQSGDIEKTTTFHLAKWMDEHMQDERVFVGGASSFHFNAFTDTPQFHGGHDPMEPSILTLVGDFVILSGMNAGSRDMEICSAWLKALGAHAFSVPGPLSDPYYHSFTHPERFEGHFPVLWRESDTTVYGVPTRSSSLAHVLPATSLVRHFPINGLDIGEMTPYVAALENPAFPEASFRWLNRHSASIQATLVPGQVISIQERYMPGWTATVNGLPQKVEQDGLGLMVLKPRCTSCSVTISYDGGFEWRATCLASFLTIACSLAWLLRSLLNSRKKRIPLYKSTAAASAAN